MRFAELKNPVFGIALLAGAAILTLNAAEHQPRFGAVSTSGTCSASLADGRSLITGGGQPDSPIATASVFGTDGGIHAVSPMLSARAAHVCIALPDGTLLVAGGSAGPGGPTSAAEIYNPSTDLWKTTGAMLTARTNAAAILLQNKQVLIAGGQTSGQIANTLEIYDSAGGRFRLAHGVLSSPRANHAIAVLADGRVLIAGGTDGDHVLDSIDVFDPETEEIRPAGSMSHARSDFTATALPDGTVLIAGGFDGHAELAGAEIYDPRSAVSSVIAAMAVPRRSHIAIAHPGSRGVLIAGGVSKGRDVTDAEIFIPEQNRFTPAREATAAKASEAPSKAARVIVARLDRFGKPRDIRTFLLEVGE